MRLFVKGDVLYAKTPLFIREVMIELRGFLDFFLLKH